MLPGQQRVIVTPGRNEKRYVVGALRTDGSRLMFVAAERKNTDLFIALLKKLREEHPTARKIHLILDNYVIHSSKRLLRYVEDNDGLFALHFLPPYSPDENKIERCWRELHANVTRNHRCPSMRVLMAEVRAYLRAEDRRRRRRPQARHVARKRAA
jgi:transposase